ncbi:MAG: hypothetical protein ACFFD3_01205 [Candidatus Thorarchaeota archaeon]
MAEQRCDWLETIGAGYGCRLRTQKLPIPEVTQKCLLADLAVMCVDAYSSLARGQESLAEESTDALPWLLDAASQFENLSELDNAINAILKGINFALEKNLIEKAYSFFAYGRSMYETGLIENDRSLNNSSTKARLLDVGYSIIDAAKKRKESAPETDLQAELKASLLSGVSLKKAEKEEGANNLVFSHGRALYEKKAKEYKDGAEKFIKSGIGKNGIVFACMGALSDLMLGKPREGMSYLVDIAAQQEVREEFLNHPCFEWAKLIFKAQVERDEEAVTKAQKIFLNIPWSYKDDREFGRRIMDSVTRRVRGQP